MNILETDGEQLLSAVRTLLENKGIVSAAEIQERMAITDNATPGQGASFVLTLPAGPASNPERA